MSRNPRSRFPRFLGVVLAFCTGIGFALPFSATAAELGKVTVFAAASTINAVSEIGQMFTDNGHGDFTPSFASSSTLAKQIAQGAPADVFISANPKWMDWLEDEEMIEPGTRADLLGNRIVLIAPADSEVSVELTEGVDLAGMLGEEKLAMGDPDHVPAGMYGKLAMKSLGIWEAASPKVARAKDVRAALALVERGEAPLGVVYATDAAITPKVRVVATFPESIHPPITYPVALVKDKATPTAKAFLEFLRSPEARAVFEKYGFLVR
ncbi:MAG: molybdate ABC transporter substrate-binding protein [Thermodesulfobacteriota bacterium]